MSRVHHVLGLGCARALCRSGLIFVHWKTLVVPKALNVRNLQKGKLELIFQGWMFFFRCQTSFREVLASEIWLRVKCPVGAACGLEGHFFSHPNLLDVCKELVGWINECQEEVVIFSFQTRNDSWIFHTFAKVWSPNWKMGMRAISSCSSLSMGVSWNRHQSTGRLPISMPQAVYLILPKADPNSMKCWNMLKTTPLTLDTWHTSIAPSSEAEVQCQLQLQQLETCDLCLCWTWFAPWSKFRRSLESKCRTSMNFLHVLSSTSDMKKTSWITQLSHFSSRCLQPNATLSSVKFHQVPLIGMTWTFCLIDLLFSHILSDSSRAW